MASITMRRGFSRQVRKRQKKMKEKTEGKVKEKICRYISNKLKKDI